MSAGTFSPRRTGRAARSTVRLLFVGWAAGLLFPGQMQLQRRAAARASASGSEASVWEMKFRPASTRRQGCWSSEHPPCTPVPHQCRE